MDADPVSERVADAQPTRPNPLTWGVAAAAAIALILYVVIF